MSAKLRQHLISMLLFTEANRVDTKALRSCRSAARRLFPSALLVAIIIVVAALAGAFTSLILNSNQDKVGH